MVASALVQEGVSGVLSLAASQRDEKASQGHLLERLEMAQSELEFALERSGKTPITDVSLLRRRMMLKCAFQECTLVFHKHRMLGDEHVEPRTVPAVSSSFRRKIMRLVQPSAWFSSGPKEDLLTCSQVRRFEWFAEKADRFARDVEFSLLARYRFSNPIVTHLLEGKNLKYFSRQGKKTFNLTIRTIHMEEEHGVMAELSFEYTDPDAPTNGFWLRLGVGLSESTNLVEISTKCLQSLGPNFKCLAEEATGQLAHLSTQVQVSNDNFLHYYSDLNWVFRPDPVCCTTSGLVKSCSTSNTTSSELSGRFPEQVAYLRISGNVSGADYNLRSSTRQVNGKAMKAWPYLKLEATFFPLLQWGGRRQVSSLHDMEETVRTEAINFFSSQPKQKEYAVSWLSTHGAAHFKVSKDIADVRCTSRNVGDGSMTRRLSKRKR
ncbi:unnamed protein product [Alopecurus aequalis]